MYYYQNAYHALNVVSDVQFVKVIDRKLCLRKWVTVVKNFGANEHEGEYRCFACYSTSRERQRCEHIHCWTLPLQAMHVSTISTQLPNNQ